MIKHHKSALVALAMAVSLQNSVAMETQTSTSQHTEKCYTNPDAVISGLPQINIDQFDPAIMTDILHHYGTFELVGLSIDQLSGTASQALMKTKEILNLPIDQLMQVKMEKFNGFQDVRSDTLAKHQLDEKFPIRNQIAFHFKPYLPSKVPEGVDAAAYQTYYTQGMTVLNKLYQQIGTSFIDPEKRSNLENDTQSVLTTRRYFKGQEGETGIPEHSDYGLLTLVVSDEPGLEVKRGNEWISAPCTPKLRFFVNVGDWMLFQMGNKEDITAGIHRVPEVQNERFSMALFLNPPLGEKQQTQNGKIAPYQEFLFSDKSPFMRKK